MAARLKNDCAYFFFPLFCIVAVYNFVPFLESQDGYGHSY